MDSLANPNTPLAPAQSPESNIEMSWDVFAGELAEQILATFAIRAVKDGIQPTRTEMAAFFRGHLERGISQLQTVGNLSELCKRATTTVLMK